MQCASLRVTDCNRLIQEWSKDDILRDDVCTAQCGFQLRGENIQSGRASNINTDLVPPPNRHIRTRQLAPSGSRFPTPFPGFKFPDLTPFIAK